MSGFDWKGLVSSVAPWLGAALGGPLGGMAGKALAGALETKEDEKSLSAAIAGATPEQLLAIQKADQDFKLQMEKLGFDQVKDILALEVADRDSARNREIKAEDSWTPRTLAACVVGGWIALQIVMLRIVIDPSMREIIIGMLRTLDAALMIVLSYYFGSSAGSRYKTEMLGRKQ